MLPTRRNEKEIRCHGIRIHDEIVAWNHETERLEWAIVESFDYNTDDRHNPYITKVNTKFTGEVYDGSTKPSSDTKSS